MANLTRTATGQTTPPVKRSYYDFSRDQWGDIVVESLAGTTGCYSIEALKAISNSKGMPARMVVMANQALEWSKENPK